MINGFLPCGLTLMALTLCIALPNNTDGFFYMLFFGLGTLPMLLGANVILLPLMKKMRWSARGVMMTLLFTSGLLLITRGFMEHHHESHHVDLKEEIICD
jgi:sulfite exporter TauE/SafE